MFSAALKSFLLLLVSSSALAAGGVTVGSSDSSGISTFSKSRQTGMFMCRTAEGLVFTAGLDGEANDYKPVVLNTSTGKADSLEVSSLDIGKSSGSGFSVTLIHALPEESITYDIKVESPNSTKAIVTETASESSRKSEAVCVVKFKSAL